MQAVRDCYAELTVQRGWSVQRVADELKVSRETLRRMVTGRTDLPAFEYVARLHQLTGRSLDSLAGITAAPAPAAPVSDLRSEIIREAARLLVEQGGLALPAVSSDQSTGAAASPPIDLEFGAYDPKTDDERGLKQAYEKTTERDRRWIQSSLRAHEIGLEVQFAS